MLIATLRLTWMPPVFYFWRRRDKRELRMWLVPIVLSILWEMIRERWAAK